MAHPASTRGYSFPDGQAVRKTVAPTTTAATWPPGTTLGRVRITKYVLRDRDPCDRDPCLLSDVMAETVDRNPTITALQLRPTPRDYWSLVESLDPRMHSDHARIPSHYMAVDPVDADPPTSLRFASTKSRPPTFSKEAWHKDTAKRKLFPFDPRQCAGETLHIYSLPSRSQSEWDGDGSGLPIRSIYNCSPCR